MCGCSKKGVVSQGGSRSISVHVGPTPRNQTVIVSPPTAAQGHQGVRAQVNRRCPKCSWPMNSVRKLDPHQNKQVQNWVCMNRKCLHREET